MGKSIISIAIFNSKLLVITRGYSDDVWVFGELSLAVPPKISPENHWRYGGDFCTWLITDHHLAWWSSLGIPQFWTKPHAVGPLFFHPTIFHHLPIRLGFRLGFLDFCPYDAMFLSVKSPFFLVEIWGNPPCLACLVKTCENPGAFGALSMCSMCSMVSMSSSPGNVCDMCWGTVHRHHPDFSRGA